MPTAGDTREIPADYALVNHLRCGMPAAARLTITVSLPGVSGRLVTVRCWVRS